MLHKTHLQHFQQIKIVLNNLKHLYLECVPILPQVYLFVHSENNIC